MVDFSGILDKSCVEIDVEARNKEEVIQKAVQMLEQAGKITQGDSIYHDIMAREQLATTAIGEGIAVPHALSDAMQATVMAVVRLKSPIDYDAPDGKPVDLFFIMAGPKNDTAYHLKLLSKLARLLHDPHFREQARRASSSEKLVTLMLEKE
ncbi:PTS sugar transporter subunit IIA [Gracilinema caldarium]|uniref:PTS IIA-like nitrogen-regulatory protein PtsN n=1 Tax=Gracilinema caldarium (strain ATCC 51460 / DSM 7334 / H1) TaxID=744872 RepID=F8F1G5_GRAC1|nr:PTS sugar transporter subunit IIA [Gracilinema caldarium]AEJ19018.1 putative PTS IIA-like nitrogen-regulatory protein PtsN [Gracilinema caldarium DSM 7334]